MTSERLHITGDFWGCCQQAECGCTEENGHKEEKESLEWYEKRYNVIPNHINNISYIQQITPSQPRLGGVPASSLYLCDEVGLAGTA